MANLSTVKVFMPFLPFFTSSPPPLEWSQRQRAGAGVPDSNLQASAVQRAGLQVGQRVHPRFAGRCETVLSRRNHDAQR